MANKKQISRNQKTLPTPLDTAQTKAVKGGNGDSTPPVDPNEVVIEDIVNG